MRDRRKKSREEQKKLVKTKIVISCVESLKKRMINNLAYEDCQAYTN